MTRSLAGKGDSKLANAMFALRDTALCQVSLRDRTPRCMDFAL